MNTTILSIQQAVTVWPLVFALIGAIAGSYLNVVALRWGRNNNPNSLHSRSRCPHCQHPLPWYDLIPLLSFILRRGRCRFCNQTIAIRYPLIEIITALLFFSLVFVYGINGNSLVILLLACVLLLIALIDFEQQIIPDSLSLPAVLALMLYLLVRNQDNLFNRYYENVGVGLNTWWLGLFIGLAVIGFIVVITKGKGMGIGDIKLAGLLGTSLGGVGMIACLFLAFLIGGFWACVLLLAKKAGPKTAIAFGPFLIMGWLLSALWLDPIMAWYT